ncbi:MAG: hypothetical protein JWQ28_1405 [Pedobacter sp.]|jgi:hypothetical protein|nr:hypothetical protein [Pedobacter sp.]
MSEERIIKPSSSAWQGYEIVLFRFLFIYFVLQVIPLDLTYLRGLDEINWLYPGYEDIFFITRYFPNFFSNQGGFAEWGIIAVIAAIGTLIWSKKARQTTNYSELYYWLRVILRFRLALGIIGYGIIKIFTLQAPFPSLSNLTTNYGDLSSWKIFSMSLGIVPGYEMFLGSVELLAGLLLLFRKTSSIGALIVLIFTGNVFISNLAYGGGEYVYSLYLISMALFVFSYDAPRIFNLVYHGRPTAPNVFKPLGSGKSMRLALKSLFIFLFVGVYGFKTYSVYQHNAYQFPRTAGLAGITGIYNVSVFKINGKLLPYSLTDTLRWKDVVFEKWATMSVRSNKPIHLETENYEQIHKQDQDRNYELSGAGGRQYYSYTVDSLRQRLVLLNRNKNEKQDAMFLNFTRPDGTTVVLSSVNASQDSLYVVLTKINKQYPATMGRLGRIKL